MRRSDSRRRAACGVVAAALLTIGCSPAQPAEQENAGGEVAQATLEIPSAMQREHAELHAELVQATQATGRTGPVLVLDQPVLGVILFPLFGR